MAVEEQPMREDAAFARPPRQNSSQGIGAGEEGFPPAGGTPPRSGSPPDGGGTRAGSAADDELTSLTWLQDTNLLRKLPGSSAGGAGGQPRSTRVADDGEAGEWSAGQVPYNPQVHVTAKPPYSFSCLIFMAIEESATKALPVKDIYAWILARFPYFQNAPTGWKNSVRHNLSLNKCFRKVDREKGVGKGSLWCIDPEYRPALVQAVRRAPAFPQGLWGTSASSPVVVPSSQSSSDQHSDSLPTTNVPSPSLFPFLSKRLAASSTKDQDVDAAATMLALQNGPSLLLLRSEFCDDDDDDSCHDSPPSPRAIKRRRSKLRNASGPPATGGTANHHPASAVMPIITSSPSEDHTYSASLSNGSANTNEDSDEGEDTGVQYDVVEPSPPPPPPPPPARPTQQSKTQSSVPPRKRRRTASPPSATPTRKKLRRGPAKRSATTVARVRERFRNAEDEMAEGAHALLNLAKIATSQQQLLLLGGSSRTRITKRRDAAGLLLLRPTENGH
ncbi:forkhead box protein N2-like isoform X2 [Ornithodoros turicata]|uniref:forkhead box protein N2-like isoform X2 n=1 Tax=Ornithodoros turicata TaxID=34597 RepID=UPI0031388576